MAQVMNEYFKGKGTAYLRERAVSSGMLAIGNSSELSLAFNVSTQNMQDYENGGGGLADSVTSIDSAQATITITNLNPINIARATAGKLSEVEGGAVSAEEHIVPVKGSFLKFKKIPDMTKDVTVAQNLGAWAATAVVEEGAFIGAGTRYYQATVGGTTGGTEPSWPSTTGDTVVDGDVTWTDMGLLPAAFAEGTDYERRNGGILILDASTMIEGAGISLTYTSLKSRVVQSLLEVGKEYEMYFDGLNEARSGKPVLATLYRVKVNPTQALPLITDDYATLQITVDILKDESITGSDRSKYVQIEMAA